LIPGCAFGKKAQVWKSTNFDAGLYDITGFLWTVILSMYHQFSHNYCDTTSCVLS